jgi:hypothetical protein
MTAEYYNYKNQDGKVDDILNFYHRGASGDIIYSLPTLLSYNKKINYYLKRQVYVNFLYSLLMKQDFINSVNVRNSTKIIPSPYISLSGFCAIAEECKSKRLVECHLELFNRSYDFSVPWLKNIEKNYVADIVINRSNKYHDIEEIDWRMVVPFLDRCIFVGFDREWKLFVRKYQINIKFYKTKDALEVAQVINGSKLFIGNQSCCFAIAEAMKQPRVLERYSFFDNCRPSGKDGYIYLNKELIEKYLDLG